MCLLNLLCVNLSFCPNRGNKKRTENICIICLVHSVDLNILNLHPYKSDFFVLFLHFLTGIKSFSYNLLNVLSYSAKRVAYASWNYLLKSFPFEAGTIFHIVQNGCAKSKNYFSPSYTILTQISFRHLGKFPAPQHSSVNLQNNVVFAIYIICQNIYSLN